MSGVTITTYTMVSFSGRRSEESQKVRPCFCCVTIMMAGRDESLCLQEGWELNLRDMCSHHIALPVESTRACRSMVR